MSPVPRRLAGHVPIEAGRAQRYRDAGLWSDDNLAEAILAAGDPEAPALIDDHQALTRGQLRTRVRRTAARLAQLGVTPDDRVVVQLPNGAPLVILTLALWRLGAIPVMVLPALRTHELSEILDSAEPVAVAIPARHRRTDHLTMARHLQGRFASVRHLLVHEAGAGDLAEGEHELDELVGDGDVDGADPPVVRRGGDVALLLLSGGTSGRAKLIPRTHADYLLNLRVSAQAAGVGTSTVYLAALPLEHNFALGCPGVMGTLLRDGRVVVTTVPEDAGTALAVMSRHHVTLTAAVPAVAMAWLDAAAITGPPQGLTVLQVGGARLVPEVARRVAPALGCALQQVYGMSEGLLNLTRLDDDDALVIETQGRPASPHDELRIVDESGADVPEGVAGELITRGPYTIRGYWRAEDITRRCFTSAGFYRTGDLVRRLPSGHLVVEGRLTDVINRGGEKISAHELEQLVLRHAAVSTAATVGAPHAVLGETVCLVVTLRPGATLALHEIRQHLLASGIARFKLPEQLIVLPALPLTAIGKIDRARLRHTVASGGGPQSPVGQVLTMSGAAGE
jgi:salicylate---CoA ligase